MLSLAQLATTMRARNARPYECGLAVRRPYDWADDIRPYEVYLIVISTICF